MTVYINTVFFIYMEIIMLPPIKMQVKRSDVNWTKQAENM
jgi:hypothetical protein